MNDLFEYEDYRSLLNDLLQTSPRGGRGAQTRLAEHLGCQQAFLSRVSAGLAELSPEQAYGIATYFNLNRLEKEYWLNLVSENRAGNQELKKYHQEKKEKIREENRSLHKKIEVGNNLSEADKIYYYSEWYFIAIHILVGLPGFNHEEAIAQKLGLDREVVRDCLNHLEKANLVSREGGVYKVSTGRIHLGPTHPLVKKHHTNWRLHSMQRLSRPQENDLHYTAVMSCSHKDKIKVRSILADAVTKIRAVIKDSPDEAICHYGIDFFEV